MENAQNVAIGDKITLEIRKQGINGEGIGYFRKLTVFVPGAILKETVVAEITDLKPGYAMARIDSFVRESNRRIVPPCPYFEKCGGCHLQHIQYPEQLKIKQSILKQALKRYTELDVEALDIRRTLGMKDNFGYRNKSQMPFKNTNLGLSLGLYETDSNRFVPIDSCLIQEPAVNAANAKVLEILSRKKLMAVDTMNPEGILLNLVTRFVPSTDSVQITLIVSDFKPVLKEAAEDIIREIPQVKGVFCSINKQHNVLMFGKTVDLLAGEPFVTESIGGMNFKLSPEAFHQLNTRQMVVLYQEVLKACALTGDETLVDAFCGVGIPTLLISKYVKMVYAIDFSRAAIKDAIANAQLNQIKNVAFLNDRVEKALPGLLDKPRKPDIIIFDPPRSGLEDSVLDVLLQAKIPKIIYVSCNPSTFAKNLSRLLQTYEVRFIQPIDMFPHTSSVESVCLLTVK